MTDVRRLTPEQWTARGAENLPGLIGLEFVKVGPTEVVARVAVRKALMAPNGFLHAGTVITLADTCCGYGTVASLPDGAMGFTTIELKSNFFGTATDGVLECVAKPLHQGRATQVWDATVTRAGADKPIARFRCTQMVLRPKA